MKTPALCVLFALSTMIAAGPAVADDPLIGKNLVTPSTGQPFCTEQSELQEFMLAMLQKDIAWMKALQSCRIIKAGLKVAVIEDLPSDSDIGHVVKIRAFGSGGSLVGYTLSIGLTAK